MGPSARWPTIGAEWAAAMNARLGEVLYWAFSAFAALLVGIAAYIWATYQNPNDFVAVPTVGAFAAGSWIIGRACLYVLAGR